MAERITLKDQNAPLIRAVIVVHVAALAWIAVAPTTSTELDASTLVRLETVATPGTVSLGLVVLASLIALGLVPSIWRDRLIHWRWRDALPGARAFSRIGPDCERVDMEKLSRWQRGLPSDPRDQNRTFYAIYSEFKDDERIAGAHRRYLASRDIGTLNAVLLIPLSVIVWLLSGWWVLAACYAGAVFAVYVLCAISARNYSNRMIQNVLSVASSQPMLSASTSTSRPKRERPNED